MLRRIRSGSCAVEAFDGARAVGGHRINTEYRLAASLIRSYRPATLCLSAMWGERVSRVERCTDFCVNDG